LICSGLRCRGNPLALLELPFCIDLLCASSGAAIPRSPVTFAPRPGSLQKRMTRRVRLRHK